MRLLLTLYMLLLIELDSLQQPVLMGPTLYLYIPIWYINSIISF